MRLVVVSVGAAAAHRAFVVSFLPSLVSVLTIKVMSDPCLMLLGAVVAWLVFAATEAWRWAASRWAPQAKSVLAPKRKRNLFGWARHHQLLGRRNRMRLGSPHDMRKCDDSATNI
jgi:hypothetical protein